MKAAKSGNKKHSAIADKICDLCHKSDDDPLDYGEFMEKRNRRVHYFCLLLSTHLPQRGHDNQGILGFLLSDIRKEAKQAIERVCVYCNDNRASIKCDKCDKYFHLLCGVKNNCVFEFTTLFRSYCHQHHKITHSKKHHEDAGCYICNKRMGEYNPVTSMTAKCCTLNVWVHRQCLKQFALTAGYYLRCLWCGSEEFREDIRYLGVFVPDRDALWEQIKSYEDFYKKHSRCDADTCLCPRGRKYSTCGKWRLHLCSSCGAFSTHEGCHHKPIKDKFSCRTCQKVVSVSYRTQSFDRTLNATLFMTKTQLPYSQNTPLDKEASFRHSSDSDDSNLEVAPCHAKPLGEKKLFIIFDEKKSVLGFVEGRKKNAEGQAELLKHDDLEFEPKEVQPVTSALRQKGLEMLDEMITRVVRERDLLGENNESQEPIELSDTDSERSASGLIRKMCGKEKINPKANIAGSSAGSKETRE